MPLTTYNLCAFLQAALHGANFYESYTGIVLPLKKLDMMGIPGKGGAVENWGLIQFDERRMLVNEVGVCLPACLPGFRVQGLEFQARSAQAKSVCKSSLTARIIYSSTLKYTFFGVL